MAEQLWLLLSGAHRVETGYYAGLVRSFEKSSPKIRQIIALDVARTNGPHMTPQAKNALERALIALANRNLDMGYCQGLNYVGSFFIENGFEEEEVFWLLCHVCEACFGVFYFKDMVAVMADVKLLTSLLAIRDGALRDHLRSLKSDLNLLFLPYFMMSFCNLPNKPLARLIMDQVLLRGSIVLFRVSLALLKLASPAIQNCVDFCDLPGVFAEELSLVSPDSFLKALKSVEIRDNPLQALRDKVGALQFAENAKLARKNETCSGNEPVCGLSRTRLLIGAPPQVYRAKDPLSHIQIDAFGINSPTFFSSVAPSDSPWLEDDLLVFREPHFCELRPGVDQLVEFEDRKFTFFHEASLVGEPIVIDRRRVSVYRDHEQISLRFQDLEIRKKISSSDCSPDISVDQQSMEQEIQELDSFTDGLLNPRGTSLQEYEEFLKGLTLTIEPSTPAEPPLFSLKTFPRKYSESETIELSLKALSPPKANLSHSSSLQPFKANSFSFKKSSNAPLPSLQEDLEDRPQEEDSS